MRQDVSSHQPYSTVNSEAVPRELEAPPRPRNSLLAATVLITLDMHMI